jgi:hypothetical protein
LAVVERNLLLALMRRLRRRRRWTDALQGSAVTLAVAAPVLALATVALHRAGIGTIGAGQLAGALLMAAGMGAGARLARPSSLTACARAVDRVFAAQLSPAGGVPAGGGSSGADDCVLAAVALSEIPGPITRFIPALTAEALARARSISPERAVPPPAPRTWILAAAGVGLVAAATLVPSPGTRGTAGARSAAESPPRAVPRNAGSAATSPSLLKLDEIALDSEREDARLAATAARDAADQDLGRLASTLHDVLDELARHGMEAASAVARLRKLTDDTQLAADLSSAAKGAGQAAALSLGAARNVGSDGASLAAAIVAAPGATDVAGSDAARLANRGDAGRAALGQSAEIAAAGLMGVGGDSSPPDDRAGRRRLEPPRQSPSESSDHAPSDRRMPGGDGRRRLEELRRNLEEIASSCKTDPQACRRQAGNAGRGLARLHREGRTAQARQRLADAARQLLERISRGDGSLRDREQLMRFARAARGSTGADDPGTVPGDSTSTRNGGERADQDRQSPARSAQSAQSDWGESVEPNPPDHIGVDDGDSDEARVGAPSEGGGIGSEVGGPLLGARQKSGPSVGHEVAARVGDDAAGPSRAEIIGGAAARGFASNGYRRLFDDYHAAVEESLDLTLVPPGRRVLVRRYFQLIRPVAR